MRDLDPDLVAGLIRRLRDTRGPVFAKADDGEVLRFLHILAPGVEEDRITIAGILALGRYPQQFFPQLNITFAAFPTLDPGQTMADGTRFLDNASLDGPIPVMVDQALAVVRRNMTRRAVIDGSGREDHWEYPLELVRELLGNAVMHRDYFPLTHGTQIRVEMYPDKLVITSPGGLYGGVDRSALLRNPVSSSRNAALAKVLEDVAYPGTTRTVCENRGTGLLAVAAFARQAGLAPPHITSTITEFRVVIRPSMPGAAPSRHDTDAPRRGGRGQQILALLADGPRTAAQLAASTGLRLVTIRRYLSELDEAGLVRPTEASRRSPKNAWRLANL